MIGFWLRLGVGRKNSTKNSYTVKVQANRTHAYCMFIRVEVL